MNTVLDGRPVHSKKFRRRRAINWLTAGTAYATMYMGRYNLSFANKSLSDAYGWNKTQIGTIITVALGIYGISEMFIGPVADRIGGRKAMLIGIFGSVIFNLAFGFGAYIGFLGTGTLLLVYFASAWALNMHMQSYSAVAIIKVNTGWFHVRERGVFSAIFGSMINSGRALIFVVGGICVTLFPWQWVFFIPAVIMAVMGILTYRNVQDSPELAGLEAFDTMDATSHDTEKVDFKYLAKIVFTNPITLTIAAAEFCIGIVRHGFEQWFPRYMQEAQGLTLDSSVFQQGAFIVILAGIAGAFSAGTISDWVFKSRRPPVAFLGFALQIVCLAVIWRSPGLNWVIAAFVANSFAITMVHSMLTGTASMDFGGKKAAASASGMFDGMQYIGGAAVGSGMGWMLQNFGWGVWGPSMIGFSIIGAILMLTLWNVIPAQVKKAKVVVEEAPEEREA